MAKAQLNISLKTEKNLLDWKHGQELFSRLRDVDARLKPETVTVGKGKKSLASLEDLKSFWGREVSFEAPARFTTVPALYWQCKTTSASGSLDFALPDGTWGGLLLSTDYERGANWAGFFRWLCSAWAPMAGIMHVLGPTELTPEPHVSGMYSRFYKPIGGGLRTKQLPNLGWATFFGRSLASEVVPEGLERVGAHVETVDGGYLVELTGRLDDVLDHFGSFARVRTEVRRQFRDDMFEITTEHPAAGILSV